MKHSFSLSNRNTWIFLYYVLLLAVYLSWDDVTTAPSALLRISYFGATLVPVFFWKRSWLPAVIILFYSLSTNGYSTSYLPTGDYTYFGGVILGLFLIKIKKKYRIKIPISLIIIVVFVTMVNLWTSASIEKVSVTSLMTILLMLSIKKFNLNQLHLIELSLIVLTLTLTLGYFLYGSKIMSITYLDFDVDRVGFADANYVGCIIGFGVLLAIKRLFDKNILSVIERLFYVGIVVSAVIALFGNASRGSLVALGVGVGVFILFTSTSYWKKSLFIILLIGFLVFLYNNSYMDILFYRMESDASARGSGRLDIWQGKLNAYINSDIFHIIFGYGYQQGRALVAGDAFHNDFLAFLVEYGIVGFISFLVFFLLPILKLKNESKYKSVVLACFAYLIVVCFTLEPFAAGRLPYYALWLYIYCLVTSNKNNIRPVSGNPHLLLHKSVSKQKKTR